MPTGNRLKLQWNGKMKRLCMDNNLTISQMHPCCAVTTGYCIPGDFVRKSMASPHIKISATLIMF